MYFFKIQGEISLLSQSLAISYNVTNICTEIGNMNVFFHKPDDGANSSIYA